MQALFQISPIRLGPPDRLKATMARALLPNAAVNRPRFLVNFGMCVGPNAGAQRLGQLILRNALIGLANQTAGATGHPRKKHAGVVNALATQNDQQPERLLHATFLSVERNLAFGRKVLSHHIAMARS